MILFCDRLINVFGLKYRNIYGKIKYVPFHAAFPLLKCSDAANYKNTYGL